MTAVVLVTGTIRNSQDRLKDGKRWGRTINVLTEVGAILGDTLEVTIFEPRDGEPHVRAVDGDHVSWVVEVESSKWGLRARYRGEGGSSAALHPSSLAGGWPASVESEAAPVA